MVCVHCVYTNMHTFFYMEKIWKVFKVGLDESNISSIVLHLIPKKLYHHESSFSSPWFSFTHFLHMAIWFLPIIKCVIYTGLWSQGRPGVELRSELTAPWLPLSHPKARLLGIHSISAPTPNRSISVKISGELSEAVTQTSFKNSLHLFF